MIKTEWDFSSLRDKSFEEKRDEWLRKTQRFVDKWKDRKDYLESPEVLKEALDEYEEWSYFYGPSSDEFSSDSSSDEMYYFWLRTQLDENDPDLKAKYNKVVDIGTDTGDKISFFKINLSNIPENKRAEFLNSPTLEKYKQFLKRIFERSKYILGEKEESIMSLKSGPAYSYWKNMVSGFLSKEEKQVLDKDEKIIIATKEKILGLLESKNKKVRDKAAEAFNEILRKYVDVAVEELNALLENKRINDKIRSFKRPDSERHLDDDIKTETVDILTETVTKRFNIAHNFYKMKAELLGQKKLEYHERNVEYGSADKSYSYEKAVEVVGNTFKKLDPEFKKIFDNFLDGFIDVYPKQNKRGGAFCVHICKSQPTYIELNFTGTLKDVTTLAHESGHGINNELMRKQSAFYFDTPKSTGEVASTFMENFVLEELMKDADEETKLSIMMAKLGDDISTISRQVACYNFEKELHSAFRNKGYLSNEEIGKIFQKHMISYMGDYVEQSPGSQNWWIYWPHIREYFYVYSYASGLLISKSLQRKVRENPEFIVKVKEFLATGTSRSPEQIFESMGVKLDENFWNEGLDEVQELLSKTEVLARKLGKLK